MDISYMSYPIASRYSVISMTLSENLNTSFFPLNLSPYISENQGKLIVVSFVNCRWFLLNWDLIAPCIQPSIVGNKVVENVQENEKHHCMSHKALETLKVHTHARSHVDP